MNSRIFVAGEADEARNASRGAAGGEDAVGILHANHFVKLEEIDVIRQEPLEGLVELLGRRVPGAAVDRGH